MFKLNSIQDVLNVAKTFGVEALHYAVRQHTIDLESCQMIRKANTFASSKIIALETFNDGNTEFSLDATFEREMLGGHYYTTLNQIRFVRTGFGAFDLSASEAMNRQEIHKDTLAKVLDIIRERNDAAIILTY